MNIRAKIGFSMGLLSLSVVLFVSLFSVLISRDTVRNRGKDFLVSILNRSSYDINRQINTLEGLTTSTFDEFVASYDFSKGVNDQAYLERYLDNFESNVKLAAELSPTKSAYIVIKIKEKTHIINYQDENSDGIPEKYESGDGLENIKFDDPDTSQVRWVRNASNSVLSAIKTIDDLETQVAVGTNLNHYLLKSSLDTSKYLDSGVLFVLDAVGELIYHPKRVGGSYPDLVNFETDNYDISESFDENNVAIVSVKVKLDNNWILVTSAKTSDIYSGLDRLNYIILIVIAVAFLISIVYSFLASKKIAEPYLYLTGKVEEIGHGNYDVVFDDEYLQREDEVGLFTNALKATVKRQKDSIDEINNYNQNLEGLIAQRTKELTNVNEALEASVTVTEEKQETLEITNKQLESSIEEIKRTRKELIETEKIASSRYMAIGIAHNLNTPIGSAKSIVSFIDNRTQKIVDKFEDATLTKSGLRSYLKETQSGIEKVSESIDDSIQLIDKIKGISITNQTENKSLINVEEVIKLQVENSKKEFAQLVCGFTIQVDASLHFRCNLYNLQRIIYELISNSFGHAFHNILEPHITIKAYRNEWHANGIVIEYNDNGVGVARDLKGELFTPLYTTKLSSKDGLGLTMVHNIVNDNFNGDITVENAKGGGLLFIINLFERSELEEAYLADK